MYYCLLCWLHPGAERREEKGSPEPPTDEERHSVYDNVPLIIPNRGFHDYHPDVLDSGEYISFLLSIAFISG